MTDKAAMILSASIVIAGFLSGGIYQNDGSKRLNKFTGTVSTCYEIGGCR